MSSNNNTPTLTEAIDHINSLRAQFNQHPFAEALSNHYANHHKKDVREAFVASNNKEAFLKSDWKGDRYIVPTFAKVVWVLERAEPADAVDNYVKGLLPACGITFRAFVKGVDETRLNECKKVILDNIREVNTALNPVKGIEAAVKYLSEAKRRRVSHGALKRIVEAIKEHTTGLKNVRGGYAPEGPGRYGKLQTRDSLLQLMSDLRWADTDGLKWEVSQDLDQLMGHINNTTHALLEFMPEPTTLERDVKELNKLRPSIGYISGAGDSQRLLSEALKLTKAPKVTTHSLATVNVEKIEQGRKASRQILQTFNLNKEVKKQVSEYFAELKKWEDKRAAIVAAQG